MKSGQHGSRCRGAHQPPQQNTQLSNVKWVMHTIGSDRGMSYVCERWRGGDAVHVRACVRVSAARRLWKR
jgi:hypothetical protein